MKGLTLMATAEQERTLGEGYAEFVRHCSVRDYAPPTIINYQVMVESFKAVFAEDRPVYEITAGVVEEYVAHSGQLKVMVCPVVSIFLFLIIS